MRGMRGISRTSRPTVYHDVRQRLVARDALLAMRTQLRNQRHALRQWPVVVEGVRQHLDELFADRARRIASLASAIATVRKESVWAESRACPTSAPGSGLVTAAWLLVSTLNCTTSPDPTALTAYAGLAPMPYEWKRQESDKGWPKRSRSGSVAALAVA